MTLLWTAFILLAIGAVLGLWCMIVSLYAVNYWRSKDDPTPTEQRLACIASALLLVSAVGFAIAALIT